MKKILLIFTIIAIQTSCSDKNDLDNIVINGTFSHQIPDCDNSENPEENCKESLWFNNDSSANIIFGGADFGIRLNYSRYHDTIVFTPDNQTDVRFSFDIQSESVLIRIQDNSTWYKVE